MPNRSRKTGCCFSRASCSNLWQVILDHQYGPVGGDGGVPAVEAEEVRNGIIIVVQLKAQAELGDAIQVDVGISSREAGRIPSGCCWLVCDQSDTELARGRLKVSWLKS